MSPITGKTKIIGILGYPVEHSFSPVMHNNAFARLGLDYCYVPFAVQPAQLKAAVSAIRALNLVGVNVTIPHKETVMPFLDEISVEAEMIGAVNTIVNDKGKLIGYNTDGQGFVQSMRAETGIEALDKKIIILGAGGAARSVAVQLALNGAREILIFNRNQERAANISAIIKNKTNCSSTAFAIKTETLTEVFENTDILINTTPVGMYPHINEKPPVPCELINKNMLVCDLIYNPIETDFIKAAKQRGAMVMSGLGMLLYQGALAFNLWTGQEPPIEDMRQALIDFFNG